MLGLMSRHHHVLFKVNVSKRRVLFKQEDISPFRGTTGTVLLVTSALSLACMFPRLHVINSFGVTPADLLTTSIATEPF